MAKRQKAQSISELRAEMVAWGNEAVDDDVAIHDRIDVERKERIFVDGSLQAFANGAHQRLDGVDEKIEAARLASELLRRISLLYDKRTEALEARDRKDREFHSTFGRRLRWLFVGK